MKKLLLIIILFSCQSEEVDPLYKINFTIESNNSNARTSAKVTGFDEKYGVVDLSATNVFYPSKFYQEQSTGDIVRSILLPLGTYNFYMDSNGEMIFNEFLKFTSSLNNISIPSDITLNLITETSQALVLVAKNLDDIPTIEVWGVGSEDYQVTPFYDDLNFYYIYVYGSWGYEIKYLQGGNTGSLQRIFESNKIYQYEFGSTGIGITDPFEEIIINQ